MESNKIEELLEKYFQGMTSIAEEKELKNYFSGLDVAPHLEEYKAMFGYFNVAKEQKFEQEVPLQTRKRKVAWLSIAATIVVMLGVFTVYNNYNKPSQDLGTFNDPEEAFQETQKALSLLSENVNIGIESVKYVNEYEKSKKIIFK
ncbi:hypothetical protein [Flavobacterium sp. '19STA2R22 D10 B1']|uniref:hypothetical protein n=1 Tax=Flavobacterium aerium TaxID=3037261 RepID=UPI00278BF642|nr:hypothetical protein [Flavobacterium sp. '19STA2R22 D10 B1']